MKKLIGIFILSAVLTLSGCDSAFLEQLMEFSESESSIEISSEQQTSDVISTESETLSETTSITSSTSESVSEYATETTSADEIFIDYDSDIYVEYHFRTTNQLDQHFEKHGIEFNDDFNYETAEDYEAGANNVINNPDALYKTESEDGDGVYYLEDTNEFVILSVDGYIRTYFRPTAGIDYFNRQ